MKATLALLADRDTHNFVRKLAWELHQTYQISTEAARLPAHVSLKISFDLPTVQTLEDCMDGLASDTAPFEIGFRALQFIPYGKTGILWLDVVETPILRSLHNRILDDLQTRLGDVREGPDGPDYHFHMTVAMGKNAPEVYQQAYHAYAHLPVPGKFTTRELVMFIYDDQGGAQESYITYKIIALKGKPA